MLSHSFVSTLGIVAAIDMRLVAWLLVGAIAGIVLFFHGFRMLQFKRLVLNTPFSKIRSASMGLVEVSGAATGPRTIPAGITGAPCYYYCATAWELRQSGNNSQWKKVAEETLYVPFFVDDSTGRLLVDPQGADLDVHRTFRDEFSKSLFGSNMFPENVMQFLLRNGVGASGNIRLEEHCVEPGYPLFVLGTLTENPDRWTSQPTPHVMVPSSSIRSRSSFSLPISGVNGLLQLAIGNSGISFDGAARRTPALDRADSPPKIAAGAPATAGNWSSVSMDDVHSPPASVPDRTLTHKIGSAVSSGISGATATVVAERLQPAARQEADSPSEDAGFDLHPPVALAKGSNGDPFTISSQSQRDVVRALAWKSAACIWGGPALTLFCFYILSEILGW